MPNLRTRTTSVIPLRRDAKDLAQKLANQAHFYYSYRMKGCPSREVPENCSSGEVENPLDTGHDVILMPNNVEAVVQPSDALPHSVLIHALGTASIREIQKRLLKVLL